MSLQAKYYIPDAAINLLIRFFFVFISIVSNFSPFMKHVASLFPRSVHSMVAFIGHGHSLYKKFVVCHKCLKLYQYEHCVEKIGSRNESKHCHFVSYPTHPHRSRRRACNSLLLKSVETASGHKFLYPFKIYCYNTLMSSLQKLLLRPSFYEHCNHWCTRTQHPNTLADVYDGRIWKEFESVFQQTWTLGLMFNIDWFQPFTHTVASVGAIYLTVMNLPRHMRSKRENFILVGIIPGPSEPTHDINTFLQPLIDELLLFWNGSGVSMKIAVPSGSNIEKKVKCALLCVSCDLPAIRKTCGFLSYSAALGCSKCKKLAQ